MLITLVQHSIAFFRNYRTRLNIYSGIELVGRALQVPSPFRNYTSSIKKKKTENFYRSCAKCLDFPHGNIGLFNKNVVYRVIRLDEFYEYISAKSFAGSKRGGSLGIESRTE